MAIASSTGTKIYIGPVNSTADDKSQYVGLSYTEIKEVESIAAFGDQASTVTFTSLGDARVRKRKGVRDAGDVNVVVANDPLDSGQLAAIAAQLTSDTYAFKVVLQDAADSNDTDSTFYFRASVSSARLEVGAANAMVRRTFVLLIDSEVVEVPSVTVP